MGSFKIYESVPNQTGSSLQKEKGRGNRHDLKKMTVAFGMVTVLNQYRLLNSRVSARMAGFTRQPPPPTAMYLHCLFYRCLHCYAFMYH